MAKLTENQFIIKGNIKEYKFNIYDIDTKFNPVGGIYIFTHRYKDGEKYSHTLIYCGKTEDLSTRFNNHHKANCIKRNNANCICILREDNEDERTKIEKDLLNNHNFTCNDILNS